MIPEYPVWSIRPNWRGGVLERLEWLTDVLTSTTGVEQRRALRVSPRRYMEITVNPTHNERSFLDMVLHKMGSDEWLLPLWFDQAKLSADAELGDSRIEFDNTYREFLTGGFALLYQDAFTWEVISVSGQDDDGLDLDVVLDGDWSAGAKVYPLRLARLSAETSADALTTTVGESVLLFQVIEPNDYDETIPDDLTFEGMPVLATPPNRSQSITTDHTRMSSERDNRTGIPYRTDPAGRAFQIQGHSWIKQGRQAQAEFREFLYWLRGRQRALWLPSFNQDFVVSRNSALASTNLDIEKIGYAYAGGGEIIPGRDVALINGVTPARFTALGAPQAAGEERLRVGAGLAAAVVAGVPGSFLSPVRLNQDTVEIMHYADTDGAMECSLTFQSFKNSRDASGTIYYPIPDAIENADACGDVGSPVPGVAWIDRGTNYFNIGAAQETGGSLTGFQQWFQGYIDNVRVTKGIARYVTGKFNVPGAEFPNDSSDPFWDFVVTLLRFEGANGATASTCEKGNAVTHHGAALSTAIRKFGDSSCQFDGINDWVDVVVGSAGQALGETFTIEAWVYPTRRTFGNYGEVILSAGAWSQGGNDTDFSIMGDDVFFGIWGPSPSFPGSSFVQTSLIGVPLNQWTHVAICRDGASGLYYTHINGKLATTA